MPAISKESGTRWKMSTEGWPTENWVGVVVLVALAGLIAIRMGFRGVSLGGVSVGVS
jgi:hypothetical protein